MFVAIYGTLKIGHGNHWLIDQINARYIGRCWTKEITIYDIGLIPGAKKEISDSGSVIEIYEIDKEGLKFLDMLEGYTGDINNDLYTRDEIDVNLNGYVYICYVYIYNYGTEGFPIIPRW